MGILTIWLTCVILELGLKERLIDMAKFKVGDIITIVDDPRDQAYRDGDKGYYRVVVVHTNSYDLYSIANKTTIDYKHLGTILEGARNDFLCVKAAGDIVHLGKYHSVKEWIEEGYRLATPAEITLFVDKQASFL